MQGQAPAAVAPLRQAVRLAPQDPLALLSLAQALLATARAAHGAEAMICCSRCWTSPLW